MPRMAVTDPLQISPLYFPPQVFTVTNATWQSLPDPNWTLQSALEASLASALHKCKMPAYTPAVIEVHAFGANLFNWGPLANGLPLASNDLQVPVVRLYGHRTVCQPPRPPWLCVGPDLALSPLSGLHCWVQLQWAPPPEHLYTNTQLLSLASTVMWDH